MFLRFISPLREGGGRAIHYGIFQAVYHCRDELELPHWHRALLVEQLDWFKAKLPSPAERHFIPRSGRDHRFEAICWFKGEATDMVRRAWEMKATIELAGLHITVRQARDVGAVCYEDAYQVVARPRRDAVPKFG